MTQKRGKENRPASQFLVVGDKEMADQSVAVRSRAEGKQEVMKVNDFLAQIAKEMKP